MKLDAKIPEGPIAEKWENHKGHIKLVNPANKRKHTVIVVGTGLAGASASASLAELGYKVKTFTIHDSPRRAHSIAAQGGINAAKNYPNDGDSVWRLFYDTVKGGDFRSREANVYRLAEVSRVDHRSVRGSRRAVRARILGRAGQPFVRRRAGFAHVLCARADGPAASARCVRRADAAGGRRSKVELYHSARDARSGARRRQGARDHRAQSAHGRDRAPRRRRGVFWRRAATAAFISFRRTRSTPTRRRSGARTSGARCLPILATRRFIRPAFRSAGEHQSKLTLMSESLRNDGRVWVPKKKEDCKKDPGQIAEDDRDYYLERKYPAFGNLVPRDVASRNAKYVCDEGRGVGASGLAVYLDFRDAIQARRAWTRSARSTEIFSRCMKRSPAKILTRSPMRIYPAVHYTMGGLWVDYNLMSNVPGLHVLGEANFSDHGANRLGASALMQGLADGYFVIPYTIGDYIAGHEARQGHDGSCGVRARPKRTSRARIDKLDDGRQEGHSARCSRSIAISATSCGTTSAWPATKRVSRRRFKQIQKLREEFWTDVQHSGRRPDDFNKNLEVAGRVADFLELGELMARDALHRSESCGGHFREESQTPDGEAKRNDDEVLVRRRLGSGQGDGQRAGPCTKNPWSSKTSISRNGATNELSMQNCQTKMNSSSRLAPVGPERRRARSRTTRCTDVTPDMSFLEMLDVLEREDLIKEGKSPDRVRKRLPRRHLRRLRLRDQRPGSRALAEDDGMPAPHARVSATATRS